MNTVKIYYNFDFETTNSFYGLLPVDKLFKHDYLYGCSDDGGKDYILLDGYTVAEGADDQPHIYDNKSNYCELRTYNDCPAILIDNQDYPLILKWISKITIMRDAANLTQTQLAEKIGVPQQSVSRWETGEFNPNIENLKKLSEALNCKMEELI